MEEDLNYYEARMDRLFANGAIYQHRTLRTLFDPFSAEYHQTEMTQKVQILHKIIQSGEKLSILLDDYKDRYTETNKKYVALDANQGLEAILEYMLKNYELKHL